MSTIPDRIASDLELIRRFYLKNGYADFRVIGSDAQFDPEQGGYIITITVEEGVQYTVASVNVESHLPDIDGASLLPLVRLSAGEIYNGNMVEKTVDALTKEVGKHGYPFSQVRPRGDRDPATRTVTIAFVLEEGPESISNALTLGAIRGRATMSSGANSKSAKATPIIACTSTGPSAD